MQKITRYTVSYFDEIETNRKVGIITSGCKGKRQIQLLAMANGDG